MWEEFLIELLIVILSHILVLVALYHLVTLTKHEKLSKKPFDLIPAGNLLFTWHIVYANGLLEMLVVRHHLREQGPLHHAHHRGLFLIVGLKGGRRGGKKTLKKAHTHTHTQQKGASTRERCTRSTDENRASTLMSLNEEKASRLPGFLPRAPQ